MSKKLSIIIPSRNEKYLIRTIMDILEKAMGDIEVIAVLDGYWPEAHETEWWKTPAIAPDPENRVKYIHRGEARGMRAAINAGIAISTGDYIMKVDAHCMFGPGFDEIIVNNMEDNWLVVPRRKRLDAKKWEIKDVGKPDVDYSYLSYPFSHGGRTGIHGTIWTSRALERTDPKYDIDEDMSFQGSCWVMKKSFYLEVIGEMQEEGYGTFIGEPQEVGLKVWLGGGKVMRNKKTWYAHLHKGKEEGRGYYMNKRETDAGNDYSCDFWVNNKWDKRLHDLEWLIDRFSPVPTWPDNWKEDLKEKRMLNESIS